MNVWPFWAVHQNARFSLLSVEQNVVRWGIMQLVKYSDPNVDKEVCLCISRGVER
jgi:hypothetical protein